MPWRGRRLTRIVRPEPRDRLLVRRQAVHGGVALMGLTIEGRARVLRIGGRRGGRARLSGPQHERPVRAPVRLQCGKIPGRGWLPQAGAARRREGREVPQERLVTAIQPRPLEDVPRHVGSELDRAAVRHGRQRRATLRRETALELLDRGTVHGRRRRKQAPKDQRQRAARDGRPVVREAGRPRRLGQPVELAGEARASGDSGHDGLVQRDARVAEGARGDGRAEPWRCPHEVQREVEPSGRNFAAVSRCRRPGRRARVAAPEGFHGEGATGSH
jgi:hypothetical protein